VFDPLSFLKIGNQPIKLREKESTFFVFLNIPIWNILEHLGTYWNM